MPYQHWSYNSHVSGAEPFAPHQFEPKQTVIGPNSIPKVFLMPEAYADMLSIAQLSGSDEIGWLGSVRVLEDYRFLIEKIFMIGQSVHSSTTRMTEDGLSDLFTDLAIEDPEMCSKILFWGHVHPSNSTEPSQQDEDQMELFAYNDWFIRGIFGRSGRAEFSLFDYKRGVIWKDIPWQIYTSISEERQAAWQEEIKAKVSKITYVQPGRPVYSGVPLDDDFPLAWEIPGSNAVRQHIPRGVRRKVAKGRRNPVPTGNGMYLDQDDEDDLVVITSKSLPPLMGGVKKVLGDNE